ERIATDTVRDLLYAYNDTSFSKGFLDSTAEGFGAAPPAVGITFLNKPLQYSIHTDNLSSPTGKPQKKEDYYNFLKRYFTDTLQLEEAQNGWGAGGLKKVDQIYYGDPCNSVGWLEEQYGLFSGDRKALGSFGPLTFKNGEP